MSELIFETIHGSHLYGLSHKDSDLDICRVTTSQATKARHHHGETEDTMTIPWNVFMRRVFEGSHQSVEALFSQGKRWNPAFKFLRPFVEGFRVTGSDVFAKYERTITKFCYQDFKRRRHAVRLSLNLRDLRTYGRFNPRLTEDEIQHVNNIAMAFSNDDLKGALIG